MGTRVQSPAAILDLSGLPAAAPSQLKSQSIFSPRDEIVNIAFPLVLLAMIVCQLVMGYRITYAEVKPMNIISHYLFLNTGHVVFVYYNLLFVPEFKQVFAKAREADRTLIWKAILIFLIAPILLRFAYNGSFKFFYLSVTLFVAYTVVAQQHAINQSYGLLQLYNKKSGISPKSILRSIKIEKYAAMSLTMFSSLIFLADNYDSPFWERIFQPLKAVAVCIALIPVILILFLAFFGPVQSKTKKLFSLRFLLWPLTGITPAAHYSIIAMHGIESYIIQRQILGVTTNQVSRSYWMLTFMWLAVILMVCASLASHGKVTATNLVPTFLGPYFVGIPNWAIGTGAAIIQSSALTHYFLEREIYKFRRQNTKEDLDHLFGMK